MSLVAYSYALSKVNLSIAYPIMTSIGYAIVILSSVFFLRETLSSIQVKGLHFHYWGLDGCTMRFDMHVHTYRSHDCTLGTDVMIATCLKKKIDGIAVTNHNTIKGALELKSLAPFLIIIGEEIKTTEGEVIGYFLEEELPADMGIEETI